MKHSVDAIGFSENKKNIGDAYKGARTDALSKAASYLGLGNDMFKGMISPPGAPQKAAPKTKFKKPTVDTPKEKKETKDAGKKATGFRRNKAADDDL